jgi:hypothetical protein
MNIKRGQRWNKVPIIGKHHQSTGNIYRELHVHVNEVISSKDQCVQNVCFNTKNRKRIDKIERNAKRKNQNEYTERHSVHIAFCFRFSASDGNRVKGKYQIHVSQTRKADLPLLLNIWIMRNMKSSLGFFVL